MRLYPEMRGLFTGFNIMIAQIQQERFTFRFKKHHVRHQLTLLHHN